MALHSQGAFAPAPHPPQPPADLPKLIHPKPVRRPSRAVWWFALLFVVAAGAAAALYLRQASQTAKRPMASIRTSKVSRSSVKKTARLAGVTVAGRFSMMLAPAMRGSRHSHGHNDFQQILLNVATPGSFVKKGDVVAEFERMYMLRRLDDYQASVNQTAANLRSLNALLEVRRKQYEQLSTRYKGYRDKAELDLKKAPVLSAMRVERNELTYKQYRDQVAEIVAEEKYFMESERASIRRSELSQEIAQMELERAQRNADSMLVKAPIDGMVVMQTLRRGSDTSEIRGGDQLHPGQPYMQIVDNSSMNVVASVNQVDVDIIRVGAAAMVTFDAYPGLELPARVVSVGAMANSRGWRGAWVKEVAVRLQLEKLDPRVIPNFSVAADVVLEEASDVPAIPRESVFTDPADDRTVAFVRGASGWEKRDVELGVVSNTAAEVKSGLSAGDVVAAEWPATTAEAGVSTPR